MRRRKIDIAVISDIHLGSEECHADELLAYLNSINPQRLILNGDIIDLQKNEINNFPVSHMKVLKRIIGLASKQTEVIYVTGNHDDLFRRAHELRIGNISLVDKLVLNIDGKKAWFFHGDVLDISIHCARWVIKLGSVGYRVLLWINSLRNTLRKKVGLEKYSIAEKIRNDNNNAQKFIQNFQKTATETAIENGFDYVVCGHIHKPKKEICENRIGKCMYLNSGDWVHNLTALEYSFKRWKIYHYHRDKLSAFFADDDLKDMGIDDLIGSKTNLKANNRSKKEKAGESIED